MSPETASSTPRVAISEDQRDVDFFKGHRSRKAGAPRHWEGEIEQENV